MPAVRTAILTITPNPSIDLLFEHDQLVWDDANRMDDPRRRPGGQGINVVRAARALGADALALTLLGGRTGAELADTLRAEGTRCLAVAASVADDDTRTFVAVRERSTGRSMLLNARGPRRSDDDARALEQLLAAQLPRERPAWVAGCGSLPAGFPPDFYARTAGLARAAGARFVPDCDGDALRIAVQAGCDLLVPNQHEAARLLQHGVDDVTAAASAARALQRSSAPLVAITLGADGAVLAIRDGCWHAQPPPIHAGSAVGAGDAFLAALLLALPTEPPVEALRRAVAAGTATLLSNALDLVDVHRWIELLPQIRIAELA